MVYIWMLLTAVQKSCRIVFLISLIFICTGFSMPESAGMTVIWWLLGIFAAASGLFWIKIFLSMRYRCSHEKAERDFYLAHPIIRVWHYALMPDTEAFRVALIANKPFEAITFYRQGIDMNKKIRGKFLYMWAAQFSSKQTWNYLREYGDKPCLRSVETGR